MKSLFLIVITVLTTSCVTYKPGGGGTRCESIDAEDRVGNEGYYSYADCLVKLKEIKENKAIELKEKEEEGRLCKAYPQFCSNIHEKTIRIGMPAEIVKHIWGKPDSVNRTVTTYRITEQWVYDGPDFNNDYLYIRDGKLSSWQVSR